jgi:hypothetical protein
MDMDKGQQNIYCGEWYFVALADGMELSVARGWRQFKVGV